MPIQLGGKRAARRDLAVADADLAAKASGWPSASSCSDTAERFVTALQAARWSGH